MDTIRLLIRERWSDRHRADIQGLHTAHDSVKNLLHGQSEVEIVGQVSEHVELLVAVRETRADAVLLVINPVEDEGMLSHLFAEYPDLTVLAITAGDAGGESANGQSALNDSVFIEQRCRYRSPVSDITPDGVVRALCDAVREPYDLINLGSRQH